jgi:hypothetical protein
MTVLSRGGRVRRGGRRPGWVLLTTLLVLAIGASSALVFTNRVELLKLAVILALWAAFAGAFVSVLYRRQSDADQSRARDLKLVYDLQLDREISARREYELTVESQLRRELASELRAQAADDLAALRAELGALRTSLEILFDTDLQHRPALETVDAESPRTRAYSDWDRNGESNPVDWVSSDRVTSERPDDFPRQNDADTDETAIIDVPEEPLLPPRQPSPAREQVPVQNGVSQAVPQEVPPEVPYLVSQEPPYMTAPPGPEPRFEPRHAPPPAAGPPPAPPAPPPQQPPPQPGPPPQPEPQRPAPSWQPVAADGQWLPPGTPGSHWASVEPPSPPAGERSGRRRRSRHSGPEELLDGAPVEAGASQPPAESGRRARSRHSAEYRDYGVRNFAAMSESPPPAPVSAAAAAPPPPVPANVPAAPPPPPQMASPPAAEPAPRHGGADPSDESDSSEDGPPTGGQSVADLFARLHVEPSGGGRRRRRDG